MADRQTKLYWWVSEKMCLMKIEKWQFEENEKNGKLIENDRNRDRQNVCTVFV